MNNCVSLNLRLCLSLHVGMDQFACLYDRHLKISSEALIFLSNEVDHQWEFVLQEFFERIIIALRYGVIFEKNQNERYEVSYPSQRLNKVSKYYHELLSRATYELEVRLLVLVHWPEGLRKRGY